MDAAEAMLLTSEAVGVLANHRLRIHWADDKTLQIDVDSGTQTRLLHFDGTSQQKSSDAQLQWQGYSVAFWAGTLVGRNAKVPGPAGNLRVVTTQMKPGYLRKNGVPYSEKATLEVYFDSFTEPDNNSWLVITSIVTDPQYLTDAYVYTRNLRRSRTVRVGIQRPAVHTRSVESNSAVRTKSV